MSGCSGCVSPCGGDKVKENNKLKTTFESKK